MRAGGFTVDLLTPVWLVTVGEGCNERKDKKWKETKNSSLASISDWAFCFSARSSCIISSFYFWCTKSIINFFQKQWTSPVLDLTHEALTLWEAKSKTKETGKRDKSWQIEGHDIWDREKQEWEEKLGLKELKEFKMISTKMFMIWNLNRKKIHLAKDVKCKDEGKFIELTKMWKKNKKEKSIKEKHLQFNSSYIVCLLVCQMKWHPMGTPPHFEDRREMAPGSKRRRKCHSVWRYTCKKYKAESSLALCNVTDLYLTGTCSKVK